VALRIGEKLPRNANFHFPPAPLHEALRPGHFQAASGGGLGYPLGWFERTMGALADVEDLREPEDRPAPPVSPIEL
jgi:hypothetical protein